ncbi:MAG: hypothetical protein HOP17_04520 [Acidobacteria bacterium]|nr:hypothetical protein [Acidobacteriota bacterium]
MAFTANSIYRNSQKKAEDAASLDKQLSRIEDDIRKLKIEFDVYFNGNSKRPPLEARARLEALVRRVSDTRQMSYAQRYQLSMLVSRYASYRELWRRLLKSKGEELV